jgi:hypothetical protein
MAVADRDHGGVPVAVPVLAGGFYQRSTSVGVRYSRRRYSALASLNVGPSQRPCVWRRAQTRALRYQTASAAVSGHEWTRAGEPQGLDARENPTVPDHEGGTSGAGAPAAISSRNLRDAVSCLCARCARRCANRQRLAVMAQSGYTLARRLRPLSRMKLTCRDGRCVSPADRTSMSFLAKSADSLTRCGRPIPTVSAARLRHCPCP